LVIEDLIVERIKERAIIILFTLSYLL